MYMQKGWATSYYQLSYAPPPLYTPSPIYDPLRILLDLI